MKISKDYLKKPNRDPHLHSPSHVLADELSSRLGDQRHFGFYLKTALSTDHNVLRKIAGEVTEGKSENPGALFAFLVKKYKRQRDVSDGYSLWLMPEEQSAKQLRQAVESLAQTFNSKVFDPHVTLVGGLGQEDISGLNKLSGLPPITVPVKSPKSGDTYWQAINLPVIKNKELLAARRMAKKSFGVTSNDKFEPHLSLLYANGPEEQKTSAVRSAMPDPPKQLTFNHICLVKTTGRVEEFQVIKTIELKEPKQA